MLEDYSLQAQTMKYKMSNNTSEHVAAESEIQVPNLNRRMTLLRIYSKVSVILRQ